MTFLRPNGAAGGGGGSRPPAYCRTHLQHNRPYSSDSHVALFIFPSRVGYVSGGGAYDRASTHEKGRKIGLHVYHAREIVLAFAVVPPSWS